MEEINCLFSNMQMDNDNRSKCIYALKNNDTVLMYRIAEDLKENYILDYNIYPLSIKEDVQQISSVIDLILDYVNIEVNFMLLYDSICRILDVVQN